MFSRVSQIGLWNHSRAFGKAFWYTFGFLTFCVISVAVIFWIWSHPYGTNWDEARYINRAYRDVAFFQEGGLGKLLYGLVAEDRSRPPAYRILALPLTLIFGASPTLLRFIAWGCLAATLGFVYLATEAIAGSKAGMFAAILLAVSPIIIGPNMRFYVDSPLYLAIAAIYYFLLRDWNREPIPEGGDRTLRYNWIGLGIALGLGGLAKPTIIFTIGPVLFLALILSWRHIITSPTPQSLFKASGVGLAMMLPWWVFNWKPAIAKAFLSGGFVRHSIASESFVDKTLKLLYVFSQSMLGPALTLLSLAIILTFTFQWQRQQLQWNRTHITAIAACLMGSLPLLLMALVKDNHNPRLYSPSMFSLAIALGILAVLTQWTKQRILTLIATALITSQIVVTVTPTPGETRYKAGDTASRQLLWGNPTSVLRRVDQWDWSLLKNLAQENQIQNPLITYLGNEGNLNPPQIALPWAEINAPVRISWLWNSVNGEIDWEKVMQTARLSDLVVTVPSLEENSPDRTQEDNQHNAEFVERLKQDPLFGEPISLKMGRYRLVKVLVFVRQSGPSSESATNVQLLDIY